MLGRRLAFLALVPCGVLWCAVLCCLLLCCAVLGCSALRFVVPQELLPNGKGGVVYPRGMVNRLGCLCCLRAVCKCVVA